MPWLPDGPWKTAMFRPNLSLVLKPPSVIREVNRKAPDWRAVFALAAIVSAPGAMAQAAKSLWVEGRVSASATLSSNGALSSVGASEQVLEINPGVRVVSNGARVKGSLDYSLRALQYNQGSSDDGLRQILNGRGNIELWDNRAFVDVSAVISDEAVSAFGASGGSGISDNNRAETFSYRLSPHFKGRLIGSTDYELRYSLASSDNRQATRSDSQTEDLSLFLRGLDGGSLTWTLQAQAGTTNYSRDRKIRSDSLRLNLNSEVLPRMVLTAIAGFERSDAQAVQRESNNIVGAGLDWRPTPRSRVSFNAQDRYFGRSHSLQLEHRTGRAILRLQDTRDVSNSPSEAATTSLGNLVDLVDALLLTTVSDPVERAQRVQEELIRLGLPGDLEVFESFLSSSATLARNQSLSAILQGRRTVLTGTFSRSRTSRLQSAISLGDDFDNSRYVLQQGLSLAVSHRLTPRTSVGADWNIRRNEGSQAGQLTRTQSLSLRLNSLIARRTSGSLLLRHTVQTGFSSPFDETSIAGTLNHRF